MTDPTPTVGQPVAEGIRGQAIEALAEQWADDHSSDFPLWDDGEEWNEDTRGYCYSAAEGQLAALESAGLALARTAASEGMVGPPKVEYGAYIDGKWHAGVTPAADAAPVADTVSRVMEAIDRTLDYHRVLDACGNMALYPDDGDAKYIAEYIAGDVKQAVRTALAESAPDGGA